MLVSDKSATLERMMNRDQRIEYEILECAISAGPPSGYLTDTRSFTELLSRLFPDIREEEFITCCKRLVVANSLDVRYLGCRDERTVFAGTFYLARTALSHRYFQELRRLVEVPSYRERS